MLHINGRQPIVDAMALSHAIMTALLDQELTGYDLTKQFEVSLGFFWQASHQQIYRTLRQLDEAGLVAVKHVAQAGKPDKKIYRLTRTGRKTLLDWVAEEEPTRPARDELFIKLYNLGLGHDDAIREDVETRLRSHEEKLALYRKIEARNYQEPGKLEGRRLGMYLSLLAGIHREQSGRAWCVEALKRIPSKADGG